MKQDTQPASIQNIPVIMCGIASRGNDENRESPEMSQDLIDLLAITEVDNDGPKQDVAKSRPTP